LIVMALAKHGKENEVKSALWWIRRDLRLTDNQALMSAVSNAKAVYPVFVLDDRLIDSRYSSPRRMDFLWQNLRSLNVELRRRGSYLIVRHGDPTLVLGALLEETGADTVYAEEDYSPFARQRDNGVKQALPLLLTGGVTVHAPGLVLKRDGAPYTVFTPFSRAWKALPLPNANALLPAPERLNTPVGVDSMALPEAEPDTASPFAPGELEACRRLRQFVSEGNSAPVYSYADARDRMDQDGTSQLSPYLRFGVISARAVVVGALEAAASASHPSARAGAEAWLNELIWREFYVHILAHFPQVRLQAFKSELQSVRWRNRAEDFAAWKAGVTGYPVVDAAMRQLQGCGWMHNRGRMIAASFLVKDLLVDWRWGEAWFMRHLLDGDPASNNGGWQWTAGTGTDAAPYFRVFNPILQGRKFDPRGVFVRRWVPELAEVPDEFVHTPWKMTESEQQRSGCLIGKDYPMPVVDHGEARQRTLEVYAQARTQ
jgi:deoxyribodipyrimidine photo-lyase